MDQYLLKVLLNTFRNHDEFDKEIQQNIDTLQERYEVTKSVVYDDKYKIIGKPMILILNYFMAVKVNGVNPEELYPFN